MMMGVILRCSLMPYPSPSSRSEAPPRPFTTQSTKAYNKLHTSSVYASFATSLSLSYPHAPCCP